MRRKTFDYLMSTTGMFVAIGMILAGSLLLWGHSFADSNVHDQLTAQQIYFPDKGSPELDDRKIAPYLDQYAGQQLTTGPQAEAYADHFIAVHLNEMPYGGVYSKITDAARANLSDSQLAALALTSFQGTTLRGLLLQAYAFWIFGEIALWSAVISFALAVIVGALAWFGYRQAKRVPELAERLSGRAESARATI